MLIRFILFLMLLIFSKCVYLIEFTVNFYHSLTYICVHPSVVKPNIYIEDLADVLCMPAVMAICHGLLVKDDKVHCFTFIYFRLLVEMFL